MRVFLVAAAGAVMVGCGAGPARPAPVPVVALDTVASNELTAELRVLGYRIGARTHAENKETVVASRAAAGWYLSLEVEPTTTAEGPKVVLRLTVFREPGHELRGEIAPFAIDSGAASTRGTNEALARALAKRAARQFAESFGPAAP